MSSGLRYEEDDDFTTKKHVQDNIDTNGAILHNSPDQVVWSDTWDLEDGFRHHIRSDPKPKTCPGKMPIKPYNVQQPSKEDPKKN